MTGSGQRRRDAQWLRALAAIDPVEAEKVLAVFNQHREDAADPPMPHGKCLAMATVGVGVSFMVASAVPLDTGRRSIDSGRHALSMGQSAVAMSAVYFIGDLHLGHRTIHEHTGRSPGAYRGGANVEEHDGWMVERLLSVRPDKRTLWWIMGDVAMDIDRLPLLARIPDRKRLVLGNHALFRTADYLPYFEALVGTAKKYDTWLSHVPVHPRELLGLPNVHGHTHFGRVAGPNGPDPRYFITCIEWIKGNKPVSLDELRVSLKDQLPIVHKPSSVKMFGPTIEDMP